MSGWSLNIFGVPYAFTTAGISAVNDPGNSSWSTDLTILEGYLLPPRGWTEQIRPLSGQLQVSSQTFTLHDASAGSDSAILTALSTKKRSQFTTTKLAASISSGATSFTLDNAAVYSYPRVIWIGREAINCQSRSGNTVTVATGGRGYYASAAEPHLVDSEQNLKPISYNGVYRLLGRGCVLWYVDDNGDMHPQWRGIIDKAETDRDGVMMRVSAKHVSDAIWRMKLGVTNAACRLRGFNASSPGIGTGALRLAVVTENTEPFGAISNIQGVYDDLLLAMQDACHDVRSALISQGVNNVIVTPAIDNEGLQLTGTSFSGNTNIKLIAEIAGESTVASAASTTDPVIVVMRVEQLPEVIVRFAPTSIHVPVNTVRGIPDGVATTTTTYRNLYAVTAEPFLRGAYDDDFYVEIWPTESPLPISDNDTDIGGGPSIEGIISFVPRKPEATRPQTLWCDRAVLMKLQGRIIADHWIYGIRGVVEEKTLWYNDADLRNWSWPDEVIDPLADATASRFARRMWVFDGEITQGEFIAENAAAYGIGVGLYRSTLCLRSWDTPTLGTSAPITITSADLIDKPHWSTFDEGVANSASVKTDSDNIVVNALNSVEEFGEGKQIKVWLSGAEIDRSTSDQPREIAHHVLSRTIGFFSEDLQVVYLTLGWQWITTNLDIGEAVDFTEWLAPNGTGGRGNTNSRGIIIYRQVITESPASIVIGVIVFPQQRGYAPAARVASVSSAVITLAAPGYVGGTSDFAGSDLPDYTGTPNDGGTSKFAAGDKVILLEYGNTSPAYEAHTINSVDPATRQITLASSPGGSMVTAISGGLVHLLYDSYTTSGLQDAQKQYAWVGNRSGVIDGTADVNHSFSP